MSDLDLSAGGFPDSTYVGKGTTVADVAKEIARLRQELAEDREAIRRLLAVLPDSEHEDDESWSACWDWLDDAAQEAVKEARNLPAVRRAIERGGK